MRRRRVVWRAASVVPALVAALVPVAVHAELPRAEVVTLVSKSVVQVRSRDCPTSDRVGTGFLWPEPALAVTAMHVVAGCRRISVYYETLRVERDATLTKVLNEADLALLTVRDAPATATVLTAAPRELPLHEEVLALGYELGSPTMGSKALRASFGSAVLEDMIPESVRREIRAVGAPTLSLRVLRLEGHLLPGLSGAPIIDRNGRVVAVGDGGLDNGAASVSWGLPAANLERLRQSSEAPRPPAGRAVASLFAADLESREGARLQCGGLALTKVRTRRFDDLARSSDDPLGLQQLVLSGGGHIDVSRFSFDIYLERDTGATVVVPAGVTLRPDGPMCVARTPSDTVQLYVGGASVDAPEGAQQRSVEFEGQLTTRFPLFWAPDPSWSYPVAHPRFDGLLVNRRTFVGIDAARGPAAYAFETLMTRGTTFAGIAAFDLAYVNLRVPCQFNPTAPVCADVRKHLAEWAPFALAVHLSTFPVG